MHWIAPSEKNTAKAALEKRLRDAAEQAVPAPHFAQKDSNSRRPQEFLGLIFRRFTEVRFAAQRAKLEKASAKGGNGNLPRRGSRVDEPAAYHAEGLLYLPAEARFDYLLHRPEAENIGAKVNAAMRAIEKHNPQLAGVLPKTSFSSSPPSGCSRSNRRCRTLNPAWRPPFCQREIGRGMRGRSLRCRPRSSPPPGTN